MEILNTICIVLFAIQCIVAVVLTIFIGIVRVSAMDMD